MSRPAPAPRGRLLALLTLALAPGCGGSGPVADPRGAAGREVVAYVALDREFSAPILRQFQAASGVEVLAIYDIESTKSFGLTDRILTEATAPGCDLFWNNEILNTIRLKQKGRLQPFRPAAAAAIPAAFRDPDGTWYGFAARARVLLVNTEQLAEADRPRGLRDLLDARLKGRVGLARPLFGTTGTHAACLFAAWGTEPARQYFRDLKANGALVFSGNRQVAQAVGSGRIAVGLTDTDDALAELDAGAPVAILYPDREPGGLGTLFIPNTLARIQGAPHPDEADALAEYLLGPEVEAALARGPGGQIPLNPAVAGPARIETPATVPAMAADFEAAARLWEPVVAPFLAELFSNPH